MKKTITTTFAALLLLSACATQDDADVLFSDTEKAIIKTLIYADPVSDASNAYESNSTAATLGQKFFWDTRFSGGINIVGSRTVAGSIVSGAVVASGGASDYTAGQSRKISCATCHDPNFGWADHTKPNNVSLGADFTDRNAPTILNAAQNTYLLWDGSVDSVWSIMRPAIEGNPHNFGRAGVAYVICNSPSYLASYTAIFGTADTTPACADGQLAVGAFPTAAKLWGKTSGTMYTGLASAAIRLNVDRIFANYGKAIAAYEKLIVSKNSAFDQWANGNENAMTVSQKRGLKIFIGKGNCIRCHSGPNFSDGSFHNLGVPQNDLIGTTFDEGRYSGTTKLLTTTTAGNGYYNTASIYNDGASSRVSGLSASSSDTGKFKVPTLRSVTKTAPYFHNGTFESLWDVINFYNFAGNAGNFPGTKDTILTTRHMTNEEMEDLVNFLKALDGEALSSTLTSKPTLTDDIPGGNWAIPSSP